MSSAAWENLHKATMELAGSATLKQRLTDAFSRYLQDMPAADVPDGLRPDFEALCQSMTQIRPMRGETAVAATVRKMSIHEADACAARIVALLDALHCSETAMPAPAGNRAVNGHGQAPDGGQGSTRPRLTADAAARIPTLISINRA